MKTTQSIDETAESNESLLADGETANLDQRRRRLVRGVAAFAPLVLTLRSGALAAASCTGARTVRATLDSNGKPPAIVGAQTGDVCYRAADVQVCASSPTTKLENVPGAPAISATIGSNGKCGTFSAGTQVAILSSSAATSFAA